jgi:hypothetical protein
MLHKDYDHKGSVAKENTGHDPQGAYCQDELIGHKVTLTVTLTL